MQTLLYGEHKQGVAKKTGKPYDMVEVSDGFSSFTLSITPEAGEKLDNLKLKQGDQVDVDVQVSTNFGQLRGTIVDIGE